VQAETAIRHRTDVSTSAAHL